VRALGTALVVLYGSTDFWDKKRNGFPFPRCLSIEVDYQSGAEPPHSKGCRHLTYGSYQI